MRTQPDHLVWGTPDLDSLVSEAARLFGVAPVEGGRHEGFGVRNYLLGLGSGCYLELIGPDRDQPSPARPRPFGLDDLDRPRLAGWAVRTDDIDTAVAAAREAGYDPGHPDSMARTRPDGTRLEWRLTPSSGGFGGVVPFLIDWLHCEHPSTSLPTVRLASLTLRHPEPRRVANVLRALRTECGFDLDVQPAVASGLTAVLESPAGMVTLGQASDSGGGNEGP